MNELDLSKLACKGECENKYTEGCAAISPSGYGCTRNRLHFGQHVACVAGEHAVECWKQNRETD